MPRGSLLLGCHWAVTRMRCYLLGCKILPQVPPPNRAAVNLRRHPNRAAASATLQDIWKASERLQDAAAEAAAALPSPTDSIPVPTSSQHIRSARPQPSPQLQQGFRMSPPPVNPRMTKTRSWEQNLVVPAEEEELMAPLHAVTDPPSPTRLMSPSLSNRPQTDQPSRCFGFDESRVHREHMIREHNYNPNSEILRLPAARNQLSSQGAYTTGRESHSSMMWSDRRPMTVTLKGDLGNDNCSTTSLWPHRKSAAEHSQQQPQRLSTAFPRRRLGQPRHHLMETQRHITDTFTQKRQGLIKGRTL